MAAEMFYLFWSSPSTQGNLQDSYKALYFLKEPCWKRNEHSGKWMLLRSLEYRADRNPLGENTFEVAVCLCVIIHMGTFHTKCGNFHNIIAAFLCGRRLLLDPEINRQMFLQKHLRSFGTFVWETVAASHGIWVSIKAENNLSCLKQVWPLISSVGV